MAAMECIHALNEDGIVTRHPIEIIAFNYEEGNELGGTFGSAALMGTALHSGSIPHLSLYGLTEQTVNNCRIDTTHYQSFVELHIEQGGMLEQEGLDIGVVEGIVGITRYRIDITGEANHAGTTPMALRRDAVLAAAILICKMEELAKQFPHPFVFTVGKVELSPGVVNVVPGAVTLYLEIRDINAQPIERFVKQLREYTAELTRWQFIFEKIVDKPSVELNREIIDYLQQGCEELGFLWRSITSGAGHDAKVIAPFLPSGLIFLPSCGGISHSPAERTVEKAIHKGAQLMLDCLLRQDAASGEHPAANNGCS
jgi:hydantoinase/carbamoylase family amidase